MTTPKIGIYEAWLKRANLRAFLIEEYMSISLLRENRGKEAEMLKAAERWADEQMKEDSMTNENVEALAKVLAENCPHHVTGYCFRDFDAARSFLASDWLAAHDEQVRREERERIAQAIEAGSDHHPIGSHGAQHNDTIRWAADVARQEQGS